MYANTSAMPTVLMRPLKDRLASFLAALYAAHRIRRDMNRLSAMTDYMLSDIGLTRDDVRYMNPAPLRRFVG